jgi:accessory colonization factor AcfC
MRPGVNIPMLSVVGNQNTSDVGVFQMVCLLIRDTESVSAFRRLTHSSIEAP